MISMLYLLTFIDWAIITFSFFNTIMLYWLGLMVLLNADRHRWGTWVGGGGMLFGGTYFAAHTLLVGRVSLNFNAEMELWWWFGWLPFVSIPYLWYAVIAWYTGVLHSFRQQLWFTSISGLGFMAFILMLVSDIIPTYSDVIERSETAVSSIGFVPLATLYPIYSTLCIILSLIALHHPVMSRRFMGDLARQRAHPWLVATSGVLLFVSLSVGAAATWFLHTLRSGALDMFSLEAYSMLLIADLIISGLIALAILMIGRAVVSYEVFTGKVLPRSRLDRHWRSMIISAASYSLVMAWCIEREIEIIYILVLVTIMIALRFALSSWRNYREHERSMERIRPFVLSQGLYDRLTDSTTVPSEVDISSPLRALCSDVLDTEIAYLAAFGPLAPLVGSVAAYTADGGASYTIPPPALMGLISRLRSPQTICVPVEPSHYGGAVWAVPLWSERGLIGVLLLGPKHNEALYTQEEIEIAQATGERLIDTRASAELAHRLMSIQRQRLAESQVLDQRTRRDLHDEILPRLHTVMLMLSSVPANASDTQAVNDTTTRAIEMLTDTHRQISNLLHAMPSTAAPEVAKHSLIGALRLLLDKELGKAFDGVVWKIDPNAESAAREIPTLTAEVLFYAAREAVRNAARYGRGDERDRRLHLTIELAHQDGIVLTIEDDGVGMGYWRDVPREHRTEGSGQGLALHSTMMAVIGGTLTVESADGRYTRVILSLCEY